jgi:hypothetical protein
MKKTESKAYKFMNKMIENVKNEFFKQHPEYNTSTYEVTVRESNRFNGDYEVYIKSEEGYTVYWCKFWNNEEETTYEFVIEEPLNVMELRFNLSIPDKYVYYDYNEEDYARLWENRIKYTAYKDIEDNVVNQYLKENEMQIRYQLAQDILSGKIKIDCYCSNTDEYDGPRNKVKIYKV